MAKKKELTEADAARINVGDKVVLSGRECGEKGDVGVVEAIESPPSRAREFVLSLSDEDGPYKACVTIDDIESIQPKTSAPKPKR